MCTCRHVRARLYEYINKTVVSLRSRTRVDSKFENMSHKGSRIRSSSVPHRFMTRVRDPNTSGTSSRLVFLIRDPEAIQSRAVICDESGCTVSSRVAEYKSMTIRTGCSRCIDHVSMGEIANKVPDRSVVDKMTVIYYDIELNRISEIEQLAASASPTVNHSVIVRTSVRTTSSPLLSQIPAGYWDIVAEDPMIAMNNFINWVRTTHFRSSGGDNDDRNIMLVAHNGATHDHVHILKTMLKWGILPPNFRLVDSLSLFKVMKGKNEVAKLKTLVNRYTPWFEHIPHDAGSDSDALRSAVTTAFPDHKLACCTFSILCKDFLDRTGLNVYSPTPIMTFSSTSKSSFVYEKDESILSDHSDSKTSV